MFTPFMSWPLETDMVLRHLNLLFVSTDISMLSFLYLTAGLISHLYVSQLQRQWDEISSCLLSGTWQGTGVTSGRIEWHSCKKVSCQQVRHHDMWAHTAFVDFVTRTVKSYTLSPVTKWQLNAHRSWFVWRTPSGAKLEIWQGPVSSKKWRLRCKMMIWIFHFHFILPA